MFKPLSDYNKILATNQFALPAMTYFMWTQVWPIAELQRLDRESRKCMVENGAKHPLGSTELLYLPRRLGGRGLKSVEAEYKATKIKVAINLYANRNSTTELVRQFEEKAVRTGRRSLIKDAHNYASELDLDLVLRHPNPVGRTKEGEEIEKKKIGVWTKKALVKEHQERTEEQKWQGKLTACRWLDEKLDRDCFAWLSQWKAAPSHTVAGIEELYQQLLPTKVYNNRKIGTSSSGDERCRLCGNDPESVSHILTGCSALAQTKYLERHNHALNILFFEVLRSLNITEKSLPWYSPIKPKPVYENEQTVAYWDVPLFADQTTVLANRIDVTVVDKVKKEVLLIEMTCPWVENREKKSAEKTSKYGPLRWELQSVIRDIVSSNTT